MRWLSEWRVIAAFVLGSLGADAVGQVAGGNPFAAAPPAGALGGFPQNQQANAGAPGQGGAAAADFDSLIDLITSTVAPDTWAENGGGEAEIRPFPSGVWLDPTGVVEATQTVRTAAPAVGVAVQTIPQSESRNQQIADPRRASALRCVSLPRLEAEILRRSEAGQPLDESMLALAGLRRVERVFVYSPDAQGLGGDLVIAGPAGDWAVDDQSRLVAADTGEAIARLDDLLVLLRREWRAPGTPLGCSITPRQGRLAATQQYLDRTGQRPLPPGRKPRARWLEGVRSTLGRQDIEVWGIDPTTNAARVLVEADHHMKRVGLGDVDRVDGLRNYLDRVAAAAKAGHAVSPLNVVRWWFAADYEAVERSADGAAYRLVGQGARVLSENEMLTARGERVHTGQSDAATEGFAAAFSDRFTELCRVYPVYSELRNVFDLAIVAALIRSNELATQAGWVPGLFLQGNRLPTPRLRTATEVDTLATSRVVNRTRVLAAVSGGVSINSQEVARGAKAASLTRPGLPRLQNPTRVWWWDAD